MNQIDDMLDLRFPFETGKYIHLKPFNDTNSPSNNETMDTDSLNFNGYDDYDTVDWVKNIASDISRKRHMRLKAKYSIVGKLQMIWDSSSGWLCVGLIGAWVGILAAVVDIGVSWLSDLKEGICSEQIWFNREQCCWSVNMTTGSLTTPPHNRSITNTLVHSLYDLNINTTTPAVLFGEKQPEHINNISNLHGLRYCNQWYSWERLITGHDGDSSNVGAFVVGCIMYVVVAIIFIAVCSALVYSLAPLASGSGIPEVKTLLGGFVIRNFLSTWTLIVKVIGLLLSVSSGLCIGHDGPMVHVAACCAGLLSKLFPKYGHNAAKTRELISAAVAAGIGACFGAPIGGVLFSLEVASFYFSSKTLFRSFFCALSAAYIARAINPHGDDHFIMFSVDYDMSWHFLELIPFAMLGIVGGMFGALVIRSNQAVQNFKTKLFGNRPFFYLLLLTCVYSLIAYFHPDLHFQEKHFIRKLVGSCSADDQNDLCDYIRTPTKIMESISTAEGVLQTHIIFAFGPRIWKGIAFLVGALVFKVVGLVLVYGVHMPTGIMLPSIMVGAIIGRLIGVGVEQVVTSQLSTSLFLRKLCKPDRNCINPGLYAVVGAVACLGGITRATVSLVVIMTEVIGGLGHIIPIMVAAMFAKWTGDRLYDKSLYDFQIRLKGYPYLGFSKTCSKFGDVSAADIMHPRNNEGEFEVLSENSMTIGYVEELLNASKHNGFPVVESMESRHLVGFVSRVDLVRALDLASSESTRRWPISSIICFTDREPLVKSFTRNISSPSGSFSNSSEPHLVDLRNIVDLSPTTITKQMPVATVVDIFISLGLRQTLVTHNGSLCGIITKKDVIRYLDRL